MHGRLMAVLLAVCCGIGCGGREEPAPAPPPPPRATEPVSQPPPEETKMLLGRVRVVDLDGNPVAGMAPIATRMANAFDAPVSQGSLTGADGLGALWLPPGERLFVRAWDPDLAHFANNFYEVMPAEEGETDLMTIQMIEGCAVRMIVLDPIGQPLANTEIELQMLHPAQGPWWPARGVTDHAGSVYLERVPAGQYGYRLEAGGHALDLPANMLPPGGEVDFGTLRLQ